MAIAIPLSFTALYALPAHAENMPSPSESAPVKLTKEQKKELSTLQKDLLEKRKEVISKYVEYGVLTKEKGQKIISRLEQRYAELEKNDFIPKCNGFKKGHHKGHHE
ncbi:YckD family protein [Bacillus songklensis]|uniref:YckD family protein n=1 Tax=Bacillus songklensis TaxID=1069116 RepID=A0ABV8B416_9BACI